MIQGLIRLLSEELELGERQMTGSIEVGPREVTDRIARSEPYLRLLRACCRGHTRGTSVQFGIVLEEDSEERLLLLSRWHEVAELTPGLGRLAPPDGMR